MQERIVDIIISCVYPPHLTRGHGLGHQSLQGQFLLFEVVRVRILDLELCHCIAEGSFDLFFGTALDFERHGGVRCDFFNAGDVRFELLPGFEFFAEGFIAVLEFGSI